MFELLNVKWGQADFGTPSGTITWSSEIGGDLPIADGYNLDNILDSLRNAFDRWEDVAAVDFEEDMSGGGDIVIGSAALDDNVVGQAGFFPESPTEIFTMTSAVLNFTNDFSWASRDVDWAPTGEDGNINFFAVALHEIGHVIGLAHPDPEDPEQIMNAVIFADDLSDTDIGGAQFIYGTDGDDIPVEYEEPDLDFGDDDSDSGSSDGGGGGGGMGLILGLLALIAAAFTGGIASPLVTMAAGRISSSDDDDRDVDIPDGYDADDLAAIMGGHHNCDHTVSEDGMVYHNVYVAEHMPTVDFTKLPNPCGCTGLCEHMVDPDEPVEDYLI